MILYITDNLLKIDRVLKLEEQQYCPAREDGIASIEYSIENIRTLVKAQLNFIVEVGTNETPPESFKAMRFVQHPEAKALGTRWLVPPYFKLEAPLYDVEYKTKDGEYRYKSKLTLNAFEKGVAAGFRITRVYSETGLTPEFLDSFSLKLMVRGKFRYAARIKPAKPKEVKPAKRKKK
jgi:hypothetical protein